MEFFINEKQCSDYRPPSSEFFINKTVKEKEEACCSLAKSRLISRLMPKAATLIFSRVSFPNGITASGRSSHVPNGRPFDGSRNYVG